MAKLACKTHWDQLPFRLRLRIRLSAAMGEQQAHLAFVGEAIAFWRYEDRRIVRG